MARTRKPRTEPPPPPPEDTDKPEADKPVYGLGEAPPIEVEIRHSPGNPIPDL